MTTPFLALVPNRGWSRMPRPRLRLADSSTRAGLLAVGIGLVVLIGWALDIRVMKTVLPGLTVMKANTAVIFVLLGVGMVVLSRVPGPSRLRWAALAFVGLGLTIALITAIEYITGADVGLDQLLFRDEVLSSGGGLAGRMSPVTIICFILLCVGVQIGARVPRVVISLAGVALAISTLNVLTVVYEAKVPPFLVGYSQMALSTAIVMGVLAVGVVGLLGPANPLVLLVGHSPATLLLRRVLALSTMVPVVTIIVTTVGQRLGIYDTTYGISLSLLGMMSLAIVAVLRSAGWVTDLETTRVALEIERDRYFELSVDMLAMVGADGRFERVNGAWTTTLGYRPDELVGRLGLDLIHPDDHDRTVAEAMRLHESGAAVEAFQSRTRHADGSYRWLEWVSQTSPDGSVTFAVARDVTDRKGKEDRRAKRQRILEERNETLEERVIRDPLTGLHNRRFFDAAVVRLERKWARRSDDRPPVSVVIFDLDHFGAVNNQYGHQAGDEVLRVFAKVLQKRFREKDLLARYGGEEFVAILEGVSSTVALGIAEDVRVALEATSIDIGSGTPIRVTVSAGCAQVGDDGDALAGLALADVWLSQAKRSGRNRVVGL